MMQKIKFKAKCKSKSTPKVPEACASVISTFPQEVVDVAIDFAATLRDYHSRTLASSAFVCRAWLPRSHFHLFGSILVLVLIAYPQSKNSSKSQHFISTFEIFVLRSGRFTSSATARLWPTSRLSVGSLSMTTMVCVVPSALYSHHGPQ